MNVKEYISSGILEFYVLNLLSDAEKKEVEANINTYSVLKNEIEVINQALESYLQLHLVKDKPEMLESIIAKINCLKNADNKK